MLYARPLFTATSSTKVRYTKNMESGMITGLNHLTLAVSDIEQSLEFYSQGLGLTGHIRWDNGAYLSAGDLWLCLSCDDPCPKTDFTHIAFNVNAADFESFSASLKRHGVSEWKVNKSEGESLYFLDPDGHKLEIHVGSLESRLQSVREKSYSGTTWL